MSQMLFRSFIYEWSLVKFMGTKLKDHRQIVPLLGQFINFYSPGNYQKSITRKIVNYFRKKLYLIRFQSEHRKIWTRKNFVFGDFTSSETLKLTDTLQINIKVLFKWLDIKVLFNRLNNRYYLSPPYCSKSRLWSHRKSEYRLRTHDDALVKAISLVWKINE